MNGKKVVAEMVGTFMLIFIGAGSAAISGNLVAIALAHGLVVATSAYIFGSVSGSHINPAVTLGLMVGGKIKFPEALRYWLAQFVGGALGAAALLLVLGSADSGLGATVLADGVSQTQGLLLEMILTFFIVNAVFFAAEEGRAGNMAGFVIGGTLTLAILMGGPLTGASLNPARTLGPALFTNTLGQFWVYLVGTSLGAILAALFYKSQK